jgi:hypothetical protein
MHDVRRIAYQLAQRNSFSKADEQAGGKKWLEHFLQWHPQLSVKTPQGLPHARVICFTPEADTITSFMPVTSKSSIYAGKTTYVSYPYDLIAPTKRSLWTWHSWGNRKASALKKSSTGFVRAQAWSCIFIRGGELF